MFDWLESMAQQYSMLPKVARSGVWVTVALLSLLMFIIVPTIVRRDDLDLNPKRRFVNHTLAYLVTPLCCVLYSVLAIMYYIVHVWANMLSFNSNGLHGKMIGASVLAGLMSLMPLLSWILWVLPISAEADKDL